MKNKLFFLIKVIISGVLLYLIILQIDWSQFTVSLRQGNIFYLSLAVVFCVAFNLIKFMKWYYLIDAGNGKHTYGDGAKSYMVGNSLGIITPLRAGDLGRALYFPQEHRPRIIGLTIIDRLMDLAVVFILAIGGSLILVNRLFGFFVIYFSVLNLVVLYSPSPVSIIVRKIRHGGVVKEKLIRMADIFIDMNAKLTTVCLFFSIMAFFLIIIEFYYLVSAFEDITFASIFLVAPLITVSTVIPVSIMGLGVREGLSVFLLSIYGISAGTALSAAFLLFIINNVSISIIGLIFLSKVEFKKKKK